MMEPFIVITAPDHFSQQAVDNISESAKGIGELIGCKVIVEASGLQIRVEPPVYGAWREEPPTEPGWYRVWTGCEKVFEFDGVFFWTTSGNYEPDGHGGWLYDHRPIEFLPPPEGE